MAKAIVKRQRVVNSGRVRTAAGDSSSALAILVLQLAGHLNAAGDALARPAGQTSARWQVLAAAEYGRFSVAQVARALGLARQGVQRLADLLESEGLARYADNPAHLRAKLLTLTPKGRAALAAIQARQSVWANALGAEFSVRDLSAATAMLNRILAALKKRAARES
jgi:DNA-binding MarR family transcriptional regulator